MLPRFRPIYSFALLALLAHGLLAFLLLPLTLNGLANSFKKTPVLSVNINPAPASTPIQQEASELVNEDQIQPELAAPSETEPSKPEPQKASTDSSELIERAQISAFVQDMINQEIKDSARLKRFESTFKNTPTSSEGTTIIERTNGIVDVQTKLLGQAVCFEFSAEGDPPVTFFKQCPNTGIKLELDRLNK